MRTYLLGCCALFLIGEGVAAADANHQLLSQSPIQDKAGKIVGFRATVLVDPQSLTSNHSTFGGDVRLALGGMRYDRTKAVPGQHNHHRDAVAGAASGYVLHQFKMREITGPNPTDRGAPVETLQTGGQVKEVEVEVLYKDNPSLVPGTHVDLVAGFWKSSYWHVWGAADSPTTSTRDFVIQLPGTPDRALLDQQVLSLEALLPKAQADAATAHQQLDAAQKAHAAAKQAHQALQTSRAAPLQALNQANHAASVAYQSAISGPQAGHRQAIQAAQLAYQNAVKAPLAVYNNALSAARAQLQAGGPNAQMAYNQAVQAAHTAYQTATQNANAIQQQAIAQAQAAYSQSTSAAHATYTQATQAAQAAFNAAVSATAPNQATISQQLSTAAVALQTATAAKQSADATLKGLTDKLASFKGLLASAP